MKRILLIFSAIAFLWGCEKIGFDEPVKDDTTIEDETPDTEAPDSLLTDYVLPEILYASMTDEDEDKPQTRTVVGEDGKKILWQNGDTVSFFFGNVHNARYTYTGEDGVTSAEFTKDDTKPGTIGGAVLLKSQAVYPYNENITVEYDKDAGLDKIILTYPTTQKYAANSFGKNANIMVAAGKNNEDNELYFRNACGYLVIKLYGTGTSIKNITLSSVSGTDKIAGSAVVVASHDAAPVITMADDASTAVTLDCCDSDAGVTLGTDAENATEFWFCLPPVTFTDGIKITVNDMYGNTYTKQTSKTVTIERNKIQPMAALEFVSNAPAATKLWYTRSDDKTGDENIIKFYDDEPNPFDAAIKSHKWDGNKFVIEFASPLTTIKEYAFRDTQIETITLPEGLVTIEKEAFRDTPLTEIYIPGSVNTIGIDVFFHCYKLTSVTFAPSAEKTPLNIGYQIAASSEYGPFYDSPLTAINFNRELVYKKSNDEDFTPDEEDEGIFYSHYQNDENPVTVTIGNQVRTIHDYMFNHLHVQTLTIPGTVASIGNDVFNGCDKLTSLTFEPSPTDEILTIGYNTVGNDEGLFIDSPLATIKLDREINYTFPDIDDYTEGLFPGRTTLTSVTIGSQVRTLSPYMFALSNITSITIPGTVTSIGRNVFDACSALTTLTFGESETPLVIMGQDDSDGPFYDSPLTTINYNRNFTYMELDGEDERTYSDDSDGIFAISEDARNKVTATPSTVNIGGLIETIPDRMFCNLPITTLTIPGTVTSISNNVFNGCNRLATLTFEPSETSPVTDLTLGYNSDGEEEGPFLNSPITSVNLNREINYTLASIDLDADDEGIFYGKSLTEGVIIGEQVRTLSDYMFSASGINSLDIPATLIKIGANAFNDCINLATLTFEESATALEIKGQGDDYGPFYDSPLKTIAYNRNFVYKKVNGDEFIPDSDAKGIFAISNDAKNKITGKSVVTIGELIQTIPDYMCNNLAITELTIPNTVANLGMHAFLNCDRLSNITIQDDTNSLNLQAQVYTGCGPFYNSPLTDIYLGREILYNGEAYKPGSSGSGIFYSVKYTEVDEVALSISNNVKTISPYMFARLKLKSITIPASIKSIGLNAFVECQSLNSIVFEDSTTPLTVSYHHTWSILGPFHQSPLTSITLGREIDYVDSNGNPFTPSETDHGFFASEDTVESLSITLTNNVKTISPYMFAGRPITQINIPASVTEIKDHAFQSCTKLASLTIPGTVNTIGNDVFNKCTSLASVTFAPSPNNTSLTLGYNTEGEEDGPFLDSPLVSVNLDREIIYTLASIDLDADDEGIFSGRPLTNGVTIGAQVKTFSKYMFSCSGITSLTIPANVAEIADHVFTGCEALASISFNESATPITIGFQPGSDDVGPFYQSPLATINLNRQIKPSATYKDELNDWDMGVFANYYYNDNALTTTVNIGANVTSILPWMFSGVRVHNIWIPDTVTSIGNYAFHDCRRLNDVTMGHHTPPAIGTGVFDSCDIFRYIVVRKSALDNYKAASDWDAYEGRFYTKDDF